MTSNKHNSCLIKLFCSLPGLKYVPSNRFAALRACILQFTVLLKGKVAKPAHERNLQASPTLRQTSFCYRDKFVPSKPY